MNEPKAGQVWRKGDVMRHVLGIDGKVAEAVEGGVHYKQNDVNGGNPHFHWDWPYEWAEWAEGAEIVNDETS